MSRKNIYIKKLTLIVMIAGLLLGVVSVQAAVTKKKPEINYKKLVLTVGQKKRLKIKYTSKNVQWSSKNKSIASVNKKGVVKAEKKGIVKIVAKAGKKKYICEVIVKNKKVKPTAEPTPDTESEWETGKKSGTEEDYNKYFALEMKNYTTKQKDTVLGKIETITYHSQVVGADREAYVYLPPEYDKNEIYPVLYMIHGIGCDKGQWYSMSLNVILSNMICREEVAPFIAVLPSVIPKDGVSKDTLGPENIGAFTAFEEEFSKDLEPYILKNFSVSSDRKDTGVCGLSMGGMEALHLGFSIKDHFNYIGSFSAAPTLNQSLLTLNGWTTIPDLVMLCSGTADGTVGSNPYNYHMTLEKNNVDHIWYQYPKGGHDTKVWQNGLVNFLKRSF